MTWQVYAEQLAAGVTPAGSRWRGPVASTPRHLFVPRWWDTPPGAEFGQWEVHDGTGDEESWFAAAYSDQTLITEVAGRHADHAQPGDIVSGRPTSSATLPSLVVRMLRHSEVYDGARVLDVATGSGYSAALLSRLLGDNRVVSIDVEPYLVEAASARLSSIGLHPQVVACDATGPLPGEFERIVSMVSVRPIPPSWLTALKPGGRLVTVIANTSLIVTATKTADGRAVGHIARDWAMFMPTRSGGDYPPRQDELFGLAQGASGEQVSRGRYPVVDAGSAWELRSMLEVMTSGGIQHAYEEDDDGRRTALLVHPGGSWARACARGAELPEVHQSGPLRLWDILDDIREYWLLNGALPLYGARVFIQPDGAIRVARAGWRKVIR
ncbi:methyltransferase domain-containing protein [Nonomuraea candida]|uniref:methyltransferase domain-containing protein n=1 Tax=Nonomuraea candida TaxID=359159 RepID=UPI0005B78B01|nr:methyltransferase domain-containing protein [Nonomuraea candida]